MPRLLALVLLALAARSASAQADLFGVVADAETGAPVVGASVALSDSLGLYAGRASGTDGQFVFRGVPAGRYTLRVTALGYAPAEEALALAAGEARDLGVALVPRAETIGDVEVEAEAAEVVTEPGLRRLRPADLAALPALDPSGDLAAGLLVQSGVTTLGDRGGQLSVRGGTPTQNLVLVDGIPLFQPFHLFGAYSALPAGAVRSADVYAGGWPARFGGRIASVVDVAGRTGSKRHVRGAGSVSPVIAGLEAEVPVVPGDVSLLASLRQSLVEQTAPALGTDLPYRFGDAFGKLHARLDATSTLQVTALRSFDDGDLGRTGDRIAWRSEAAGGQFFSISSAFAAALDISAYWSHFATEFTPGEAAALPARTAESTVFGGRFGYVYYVGPHTFRTGLQTSSYLFRYAFRPGAEQRDNTSEGSFYVDADLRLGAGWEVEPGLRVQTFPSQSQPSSLEPRLRVSWARGPHVLRGALGVYRQEIIGLTDQRDVGDVFTAWTTARSGSPVPTARHALLGWEGPLAEGVRAGVEGYAKRLTGQAILVGGEIRSTNGEAFGADLTLGVARGPARLDVRYSAAALTFRDAERTYRPPFHRPHRLVVTGRAERGPWAASAAFQLTSGRPFTRVTGTYRDLGGVAPPLLETAPGVPLALYEDEPYAGRTPPYLRLDLSAERTFRFPGGRAIVQAAVLNATDRANVFYYDAIRAERVDQLPLLPTLGLRVESR